MANTVLDSKPVPYHNCRVILNKMLKCQEAMLEHCAAGNPKNGIRNSWSLRISLRDLHNYIGDIINESNASSNNTTTS